MRIAVVHQFTGATASRGARLSTAVLFDRRQNQSPWLGGWPRLPGRAFEIIPSRRRLEWVGS